MKIQSSFNLKPFNDRNKRNAFNQKAETAQLNLKPVGVMQKKSI